MTTKNGDTPAALYKITCRICGEQLVQHPALEIPIIGEPDAKAKKIAGMLQKHVMLKHMDQIPGGMQLIAQFQEFLLMTRFEYSDPSIQARFDVIRGGLHALSRKFSFSDEHIEQGVNALVEAQQLNPENVAAMIKTMRDVLTEQGQYAPQIPEETRRILVP